LLLCTRIRNNFLQERAQKGKLEARGRSPRAALSVRRQCS